MTERGVVFLASVPTNMRPTELCLHLQQFGELFRHKFVPMPKKYVGSGSSRKLLPLQYRSAFVEFMNREHAKVCAAQLNGSAVASKKRRKCFGQIWNIRYMGDGFTWGNVLQEREEQVRRHQQLEFSFRESERRSNEAFRKLVLRQAAAADAAKARRQQLTEQRALKEGDAEEATDCNEADAAPKRRRKRQLETPVAPQDKKLRKGDSTHREAKSVPRKKRRIEETQGS